MTSVGSVWSTQTKNEFSYKIGVATIFLVSSFVTVMLSVTSLTNIIFFQMGQQVGSDVDIILMAKNSFEPMLNLNKNPYAQNPFKID